MSRAHILLLTTIAILFMTGLYRILDPHYSRLPIVAIANYGSHSSLQETVRGIKDGLYAKGFREGKTVEFEIVDVNFDKSQIMNMLDRLRAIKPKVIVAISTPVAQMAKNSIKDIPIIFAAVTDPVEAGILKQYDKAEQNITGSADTQELALLLKFAKQLSPMIKKVGILYATHEANDIAMLKSMEKAAVDASMELVAISVESANEIPEKMNRFKDVVDMIYVGPSGPIQPSLPVIVSIAETMKIPVFNMNAEEVKENKVFASYGISYYKVGVKAGHLVSAALKGKNLKDIVPVYPDVGDHDGFISTTRLNKINFQLPRFLPKSTYIIR